MSVCYKMQILLLNIKLMEVSNLQMDSKIRKGNSFCEKGKLFIPKKVVTAAGILLADWVKVKK